ncbi:hypothetical protein Tco_0987769, partial [Tanacetum coccineum]
MTADETIADKEVWANVKFADDMCNELKVSSPRGKQVEVIIDFDDDTEDDAFSVSDSKDDAFSVSDYEDDAFSVSDYKDDESEDDDDTIVMWVVLNVHASTSKAPRSAVGCSNSKKGVVGCSSSKKGIVGCSSTKQRKWLWVLACVTAYIGFNHKCPGKVLGRDGFHMMAL